MNLEVGKKYEAIDGCKWKIIYKEGPFYYGKTFAGYVTCFSEDGTHIMGPDWNGVYVSQLDPSLAKWKLIKKMPWWKFW